MAYVFPLNSRSRHCLGAMSFDTAYAYAAEAMAQNILACDAQEWIAVLFGMHALGWGGCRSSVTPGE
jgi:hypothetical protein